MPSKTTPKKSFLDSLHLEEEAYLRTLPGSSQGKDGDAGIATGKGKHEFTRIKNLSDKPRSLKSERVRLLLLVLPGLGVCGGRDQLRGRLRRGRHLPRAGGTRGRTLKVRRRDPRHLRLHGTHLALHHSEPDDQRRDSNQPGEKSLSVSHE